jgi:hypothetical protein
VQTPPEAQRMGHELALDRVDAVHDRGHGCPRG